MRIGARGAAALGGGALLLTAALLLAGPQREAGPGAPQLPPQELPGAKDVTEGAALADVGLATVIGSIGADPVRIRDLGEGEQQAVLRLLALLDETKREALSRLEEEALLSLDPQPEDAGALAIDAAEIDAFLRGAPPLPAAAGDARELARHVLSLRAQRAVRSRHLASLRERIATTRFVPERGGDGPWPAVVARVGTRSLRNDEVEQEARVRLFWLRSQLLGQLRLAFDAYADAALLARAAAARGITAEALAKERIPPAYAPSEAEVDAEIQRHRLPPDGDPARRQRARELLVFRAGEAGRQALLAELRAETPVAFRLAAPTPPRIDVAGSGPQPGDPPVTLVAFTNLRCRICADTHAVLDAIEAGPRGRSVRILRRPLFPEAALPLLVDALAESCASAQGAGPALRHAVLEATAGPAPVDAARLGLSVVATPQEFQRCMADPRSRATVLAQRAEAERLGFEEAPGFLVDGLPLPGFQGQARLEEIIAAALAAAAKPDAVLATLQRRSP